MHELIGVCRLISFEIKRMRSPLLVALIEEMRREMACVNESISPTRPWLRPGDCSLGRGQSILIGREQDTAHGQAGGQGEDGQCHGAPVMGDGAEIADHVSRRQQGQCHARAGGRVPLRGQ